MNRFVLDWLSGDERFLPRLRGGPPSPAAPDPRLVEAIVASNRRWGNNIDAEARRWAAGETQIITSGQQVGFAGGPLYTLVKLASLLKLKRDNESKSIPTTVLFWMATEDHDFDEIAKISIPNRDPNRQRDLITLRATRPFTSRRVVGREAIPESLIQELVATLGIERPKWLRPGITFGDSFAELMTTVGGGPFILIDSLLPEVRRAGAPLFQAIARKWTAVQKSIAKRSAELQRAGYTPQIVPREGEPYTLLYRIDADGNRELLQNPAAIDAPESISTSALTRPLLQDFVFRPSVFVGGPAEVAYYAQIAPLHRLLDVPMPRVALRGHVLVGPKRVIRYLSRFEIKPEEVFSTPEQLVANHEERQVAEIRAIAEKAQRTLNESIEKIRAIALPADHAVARSINRSIGHIEYHFKKLAERAIRGLVRKEKERFQAARELVSTFYPDQQVQDRVVAWFPFWSEYGNQLVERIVEEVEPDTAAFKIVSL
jgi:bacillithiol biosynthesis cysteine-adding enzyme BshC